jgi:hypothetical protein
MTRRTKSIDRQERKAQRWGHNHSRECHYCGRAISEETATEDHIVPLSHGGSPNNPKNILYACRYCNSRKGSMPYEVFKAAMLPVKQARRAGLPIPEVTLPQWGRGKEPAKQPSVRRPVLVRVVNKVTQRRDSKS